MICRWGLGFGVRDGSRGDDGAGGVCDNLKLKAIISEN